MASALLYLLPEQPDPATRVAHWWLVADGAIAQSACDETWPAIQADRRVGLAPASAVRIERTDRPTGISSDRQALSVARFAALEASLGAPEALHAVAALDADGAIVTAVVDNGTMLAWLCWSESAGAEPDAIVPVGSLLPAGPDWVEAEFGGQRVFARDGLIVSGDSDLVSAIVEDSEVRTLGGDEQEGLLRRAADSPPIDLRSARFARRRGFVVDRSRIRELILLAAAIPLITLLSAIIAIVKLDRSASRMDAQTTQIASQALGREVPPEEAEAALRLRSGGGGFVGPMTALYRRLRAEPGVSATVIGYRGDGTLSATLAAPTVVEVNRVLVALQGDAYRITAVPRQGPDGRATVDITLRSGS